MNDSELTCWTRWISFMARAVYFHTTLNVIQYCIILGFDSYCYKMGSCLGTQTPVLTEHVLYRQHYDNVNLVLISCKLQD